MPSEHPILCTGEEVRAILEGRKTQTRRVMKHGIPPNATELRVEFVHGKAVLTYRAYPNGGTARWAICECPYGGPGDLLWVRETWAVEDWFDDLPPADMSNTEDNLLWYRADASPRERGAGRPIGKWRPSIHMPKWACRLWLGVVDVRVQRVQEISKQDASAEGTLLPPSELFPGMNTRDKQLKHFPQLWDSINGKRLSSKRGYGWDVNPFVWAVTFKRRKTDAD